MRLRPRRLALFLSVFTLHAQDATVTVRIKLIDGRTGQPVRTRRSASRTVLTTTTYRSGQMTSVLRHYTSEVIP